MSRISACLYTSVVVFFCLSCGDSNRITKEITLQEFNVSIDYEQPMVPEKEIISTIRHGGLWNLNMTEKPVLFKTEDTNLLFGAGYLYSGTYSVWIQRGRYDNWFILFNEEIESLEYNEKLDFAILPFVYSTLDTPVKQLMIDLTSENDQGNIVIQWGHHQFAATFSLPPVRS